MAELRGFGAGGHVWSGGAMDQSETLAALSILYESDPGEGIMAGRTK